MNLPTTMNSTDLRDLQFFVLRGTLSDLSVFDFYNYNAKIQDVNDPKFKEFLDQYPSPLGNDYNWKVFQEFLDEVKGTENIYALLPINLTKQFSEDDLYHCYSILLLLFPSDLTINYIVDFQLINNKQLSYSGHADYGFHSTGYENYYDNYTFVQENYLVEVNEFISIFKTRYKRIKYINNALESYVASFRYLKVHQCYLDLCIALESIIEGPNEIQYRIKHHVAVLCAENEDRAKIIFNNLSKIYSLRSKIIHGESYDYNKVFEYLPYLRGLVSRMIIELILLNIPVRSTLDSILTFAGYRKQPNLSTEYKAMTLNISSYTDTFKRELK
jgi:hypothetical protein